MTAVSLADPIIFVEFKNSKLMLFPRLPLECKVEEEIMKNRNVQE